MSNAFFRKYSDDELRVAFGQFDQDKSGYIQAKELESLLNKIGRHVSKAEVDAIIHSLDDSGDGKVSFDEFKRLF